MVEYRQRLKDSPDIYKAYLESEAKRNKEYRASLTEEQTQKQQELTRLRVKRFRKRERLQLVKNKDNDSTLGDNVTSQPKVKHTRQKVTERRDYWKKEKQDQRNNMTAQKRTINEKSIQRKRQTR